MSTPDRQPNPESATTEQSPPTAPGELRQPEHRRGPDGLDDYHKVADTVGGLPNLRARDNIVQTLFVVGGTILFALVGYVLASAGVIEMPPSVPTWVAAAIGGVAGMILCTFLSGFVLMILGVKRTVTKKRR